MIKDYLRARRTLLVFVLIACGLLPLLFWLWNAPMQPVRDFACLFGLLYAIWTAADMTRFARRRTALLRLEAEPDALDTLLPAPADALEARYQRMLRAAHQQLTDQAAALQSAHQEQIDYYTMWLHQIKTPIAASRLLLEQRTPPSPALLEQELFTIERYVEMALHYVKLGLIGGDMLIQSYDLDALVKKSVRKYAPQFIYRKLSVRVEPLPRTVDTDAKWFAFILEQVLSNAVKYTQTGGVVIDWQNGALRVTDTGIGVRAEDLPRVFDKGYTGRMGRVDLRASGIGLYLAKRAADALSLRLTLTSKLGEGTRVSIQFPESDENVRLERPL